MNNKERSIIACKKQAHKYHNPKIEDRFFNCKACYLCYIYCPSGKKFDCKGCPLATSIDGALCCKQFKTHINAYDALLISNKLKSRFLFTISIVTLISKLTKAFEARAKFYDWLAIELEKYPAFQFTKKGWKDFNLDINL